MGPTTKHTIVTERGRIKIRRNKSWEQMEEEKRDSVKERSEWQGAS